MSILVKDTDYVVGNPIKPGQKDVKVKWEFEEGWGLDNIATTPKGNYIFTKSCGCTADVKFREDGIYAVYNDSTKSSILKNASSKTFTKTMTVYLKGDQPLYKTNPMTGETELDTESSNVVLRFKVTVKN